MKLKTKTEKLNLIFFPKFLGTCFFILGLFQSACGQNYDYPLHPKWELFKKDVIEFDASSFDEVNASKKHFWIPHRSGIIRINPQNRNVKSFFEWQLGFTAANDQFVSNSNKIFFGTAVNFSLASYDGKNWEAFDSTSIGFSSGILIRDLAKDGKGNIWIWTKDKGMARYDGNSWKTFDTTSTSLLTKRVKFLPGKVDVLGNDSKGNIEVLTEENKVIRYNGNSWQKVHEVPWPDTFNYTSLVFVSNQIIDSTGNIWVWNEWNGNYLMARYDGNSWKFFDTSNSSLPKIKVHGVTVDKSNNVWIAARDENDNGKGVYRYDGNSWKLFDTSNSNLPSNLLEILASDNQGNVWFYADEDKAFGEPLGLVRFKNGNFKTFDTKNSGIPSNEIFDMALNNGTKLMTTKKGVVQFDGSNWYNYSKSDFYNRGIPSNQVNALANSKEGSVWIGTNEGIGVYNQDSMRYFTNIATDDVRSIIEDKSGNVWVGYHGFGNQGTSLRRYDGNNWKDFDLWPNIYLASKIKVIEVDKGNNKWIGTENGLVRYDGTNFQEFTESNSDLTGNWITALKSDNKNNIWVGVSNEGLFRYDGSNWKLFDKSLTGFSTKSISCLSTDKNGDIWIGTDDKGIARYDGNNWQTWDTSSSGLHNNTIKSIAIDGKNNKWIGTNEGVSFYDGKNWKVFNMANSPLPSNSIQKIEIGSSGEILIGTDKGMAVYNGKGSISGISLENTQNFNFKVYPNPTQDQFTIQLTPNHEPQTYQLQTLTGRTIQSGKLEGKSRHTVDVSDVSAGVYLLQVKTKEAVRTKKVVVE